MSERRPHHDDHLAMAAEVQVELTAAERLQQALVPGSDPASSLSTLELGYYEAELRSLRGAAASLDEVERRRDPS